jgi:hypothetical protein
MGKEATMMGAEIGGKVISILQRYDGRVQWSALVNTVMNLQVP